MKFYKTIEELPVWNFQKLHETTDLRYLIRGIDYDDMPDVDLVEISDIFTKINDEFMNSFGMTDEFNTIHETKKALAMYMIMYMEGQKSLSAIIAAHERKLERIDKRDNDRGSFESAVAGVEKWLGSAIDVHKVSVKRFYTYIEMMRREAKSVTLQSNG